MNNSPHQDIEKKIVDKFMNSLPKLVGKSLNWNMEFDPTSEIKFKLTTALTESLNAYRQSVRSVIEGKKDKIVMGYLGMEPHQCFESGKVEGKNKILSDLLQEDVLKNE